LHSCVGRKQPPSECPVCGADVPRDAVACPECGADERTGWNEDATRYNGVDLPEHAFEDTTPGYFEKSARRRQTWMIVGLFVLVALVLTLIF
jgi:predicted nucleic acid-binding Zn ribbon protein